MGKKFYVIYTNNIIKGRCEDKAEWKLFKFQRGDDYYMKKITMDDIGDDAELLKDLENLPYLVTPVFTEKLLMFTDEEEYLLNSLDQLLMEMSFTIDRNLNNLKSLKLKDTDKEYIRLFLRTLKHIVNQGQLENIEDEDNFDTYYNSEEMIKHIIK